MRRGFITGLDGFLDRVKERVDSQVGIIYNPTIIVPIWVVIPAQNDHLYKGNWSGVQEPLYGWSSPARNDHPYKGYSLGGQDPLYGWSFSGPK